VAPNIRTPKGTLDSILEVGVALDPASSEFLKDGNCYLDFKNPKSESSKVFDHSSA